MKKDNLNKFHRKATCDRLLIVWDKMPELTLAEIICNSTDIEKLKKMSDEVLVHNCAKYIKVYKEENSLKNKFKKGLKSCVTKLTLW